jgi:hypothetical protein
MSTGVDPCQNKSAGLQLLIVSSWPPLFTLPAFVDKQTSKTTAKDSKTHTSGYLLAATDSTTSSLAQSSSAGRNLDALKLLPMSATARGVCAQLECWAWFDIAQESWSWQCHCDALPGGKQAVWQ